MKKRHPIIRFFKHFFSNPWQVRWHFPITALRNIERAIAESEKTHSGEIRFVVEAGLHPLDVLCKKSPKIRAIEIFGRFNIWDTEQNNGVLIYLLLADHDFEIISDRGIHQYIGKEGWERISQQMELMFKRGEFEAGVLFGITEIGALLTLHYSTEVENNNELSNVTIIL
jgi:uncharacterized membrane protein